MIEPIDNKTLDWLVATTEATYHRWGSKPFDYGRGEVFLDADEGRLLFCKMDDYPGISGRQSGVDVTRDAQFVAAASPSTILALIARLAKAEGRGPQ